MKLCDPAVMPRTALATSVIAVSFLSSVFAREEPIYQYNVKGVDTAPPTMHLCVAGCSTGRGTTLIWGSNRYRESPAGDSIYYLEKFNARDGIVIRRVDGGKYPGVALLTGQLSTDGKHVVNGKIQWIEHKCCGLTSGPFQAAWGDAISTVPGKKVEAVQSSQGASAEDQSRAALQLLFSVIAGNASQANSGDDSGGGSQLTRKIASLEYEVDKAGHRCAAYNDNRCSDQERLKSELADARAELDAEIQQLNEARQQLEPECKAGNQESCDKLVKVNTRLKQDQSAPRL